jgi:hypothetical protein
MTRHTIELTSGRFCEAEATAHAEEGVRCAGKSELEGCSKEQW